MDDDDDDGMMPRRKAGPAGKTVEAPGLMLIPGSRNPGDITLRKLQVFWAVAHAGTLTRAAKLLGVSQPSLSQLLSSFESAVGARLFDRRSNAMELTETGSALLAQAEAVLRSFQALEDGIAGGASGRRKVLRIAGVSSVMRTILPAALARLTGHQTEFDLHEAAPSDIVDLLHARRATLGLVTSGAITEVGGGFQRFEVFSDPYVLAVPAGIDLATVTDPARELTAAQRATLSGTIQFVFGNRHSARVQGWYDRVLPGNRVVARARSFELAVEMVRAGLGVAVVPALCVAGNAQGITLHDTGLSPRRVVAMLPQQSARQPVYVDLIAALRAEGATTRLPPVRPAPPFMAGAGADDAALGSAA